jgi:RNA polymerase sigma-70 factor (ECF subfamily)
VKSWVHDQLEAIARDGRPKLLAYLAGRFGRDVQAAEDALSDAFASALTTWPLEGVPKYPESWLLKVARNRLIDQARRTNRRPTHVELQVSDHDFLMTAQIDPWDTDDIAERIPDERLQMMFALAHPAIDATVRTPLLLQVVLGLSADRIASAFLVSPKTMGQRLVRAKLKIRDAGISFRIPEQIDTRIDTVLEAIYAAFAIGWDNCESSSNALIEDAISLARIVVECANKYGEAAGLLALLLYSGARQSARRSPSGAYVPIDQQATDHWDQKMIAEAEQHLKAASQTGVPGRYQLEAAIQSAHMSRSVTGQIPWGVIRGFYDMLITVCPTIGVQIARAAAIASSGERTQALNELNSISQAAVNDHQPYWAVRSEILRQCGNPECFNAYDRAIGLCSDPVVRLYLQQRKDGCEFPKP